MKKKVLRFPIVSTQFGPRVDVSEKLPPSTSVLIVQDSGDSVGPGTLRIILPHQLYREKLRSKSVRVVAVRESDWVELFGVFPEPPPILWNEDGAPTDVLLAEVRKSLPRFPSPGPGALQRRAFRIIVQEADWMLEDLPCYWTEDEEHLRYVLSAYREIVDATEIRFWRPFDFDEGDGEGGEFGKDGWVICPADHPNAVAYLKVWDV